MFRIVIVVSNRYLFAFNRANRGQDQEFGRLRGFPWASAQSSIVQIVLQKQFVVKCQLLVHFKQKLTFFGGKKFGAPREYPTWQKEITCFFRSKSNQGSPPPADVESESHQLMDVESESEAAVYST